MVSLRDLVYRHGLTIAIVSCIFGFALVYYLMDLLTTENQFNRDKDKNSFGEKLYFSLVTQTTVGYGDVVPVTTLARVMVCIQILITVMLALYIGSYVAKGV